MAISNSRIVALQDRMVTFKYRKKGSSRYRTTTLEVMEFIRRFLQHVLPPVFMKVLHFGLMSSNCSIPIQVIRRIVLVQQKDASPKQLEAKPDSPGRPYCPDCGAILVFVKRINPVLGDTG